MYKFNNIKVLLIIFSIIFVISLNLLGCSRPNEQYDKGYEDGYDGARKNNSSKNYLKGYEDGADDAYYFDLGYSDAQNSKPPQYPNDSDYMDGYNEGK